jgi:hypothetical protein
MVQTTNKNLEIIKKFKKKLEKIGVNKIIFFGSRTKGTFDPESDFDIIVISKNFEGVKWNERPLNIYLAWKEKKPLEVLCYTPEEFEKKKKQIGIVKTAVKEGIEV